MNKILFKIHSLLALIAFAPLVVICITGSILVFKPEIDRLLMPEKINVVPQEKRMPFTRLLASVNLQQPDYEAVGWLIPLDRTRADQVYLMERGTSNWSFVHLDPYSGKLQSNPQLHDYYFTDWLLELHFNFLLHDAGLVITAIVALLLLALGITGIILHRKFWKNLFRLRWRRRLVVYFSDLHKMVGVLSSPILVILAFTGIWWNVAELLHEMQAHTENKEHHLMQQRLYNQSLSLDRLLSDAQSRVAGFQPTYITLPYEPGIPISFWGDVPTNNILNSQYASMISFDSLSGNHLTTFDIRQADIGATIVDSYRRLHFGDFAGIFSRVIWAIIGLSPLILAATGITLWWKRRHQRRTARAKRQRHLISDSL